MNELKVMRVFVRCVERGSFSAVAREFDTTQPNISKMVAALETHLGGKLFVRAAQGVRLSLEGQQYYSEIKEVVDALARAEENFGQTRSVVSGLVRLSASQAFARLQILPHLPTLMARYPQLQVDLQLNDRLVDLVEENIDIAFRLGNLKDSALLARRLGSSKRVTVATPGYLHKFGIPRTPAELAEHECIFFDQPNSTRSWTYFPSTPGGSTTKTNRPRPIQVRIAGHFQTNSPEAVRQAVLGGLGIAQVSAWMVGADVQAGRLCLLLEDYAIAETPIHAVFTQNSRNSAKIRAVIDFYEAVFREEPSVTNHEGG
ncbi:LysR family transcriptional regulator [Chitinimonas sp. PSY-7]|uniref:LysR substrate-binding domain-containing protein n=1 Tax=Chitinimonas sp. PSY-7 TaxID=3459088 RepID=UPI00403FF4CC